MTLKYSIFMHVYGIVVNPSTVSYSYICFSGVPGVCFQEGEGHLTWACGIGVEGQC